jgi:hypothetical protein
MTTDLGSITDGFSVTVSYAQTRIAVAWQGTATLASRSWILALLARLHESSTHLCVREAVIDLRELEVMDPACFVSFVAWIEDIRKLEEAHQYKLQFRCDPKSPWQKRSIEALQGIADDLVTMHESSR